jgi:hypothetical protein
VSGSANALGVYVPVGHQITGIPDALYPAPDSLIRRILEFDKDFRPLWVNQWWKSPNGGIVKTGHHMLARYVPNPRSARRVIKGLVLPTVKTYGVYFKPPILEALLLDGLSQTERDNGALPRYVPFTSVLVENMRANMWRRNNLNTDERVDAAERREEEETARKRKRNDDESNYRRRHDSHRFPVNGWKAPRVFVSDTLVKLREAAGMA